MNIVERINNAYAPSSLIRDTGAVFYKGLDVLLEELCKKPITTFEEVMISAAKKAASNKDKNYSVLSIYNILILMGERRVYEIYQTDFKNTRKEIHDILNKEHEMLENFKKKHQELQEEERDGE